MTQVDLSSYKNLFVKNAGEYLDKLASDLTLLKEETTNTELINNAYISIHSLSSQNLAMGYVKTGSLCKLIEGFFYKIKQGQEKPDAQKIQLIIDAATKIRASIENIQTNNAELDLDTEIKSLEEKLEQ